MSVRKNIVDNADAEADTCGSKMSNGVNFNSKSMRVAVSFGIIGINFHKKYLAVFDCSIEV